MNDNHIRVMFQSPLIYHLGNPRSWVCSNMNFVVVSRLPSKYRSWELPITVIFSFLSFSRDRLALISFLFSLPFVLFFLLFPFLHLVSLVFSLIVSCSFPVVIKLSFVFVFPFAIASSLTILDFSSSWQLDIDSSSLINSRFLFSVTSNSNVAWSEFFNFTSARNWVVSLLDFTSARNSAF